jgi:hypothetical protein
MHISSRSSLDELVVGRLNPVVERPAPRLATPVSFPNLEFLRDLEMLQWNQNNKPNLFDLRLRWQYPPHGESAQRLGTDVFKTINVAFEPACDFEKLFSCDKSLHCLPPEEWGITEPSAGQRKEVNCRTILLPHGSVPAGKLSNGRPYPTRGDFWERATQLKLSNIDGFRGYARMPTDGLPLPRVTHARPFYEHLDGMVQYWDTSLDEYIPPPLNSTQSSESDTQPRKRTKLSPDAVEGSIISPNPTAPSIAASTMATPIVPPTESATLADSKISVRQRPNSSRRAMPGVRRADPSPPPPGTYRGWRIDSGKNMPNGTRDLLVKALLEIAMWPFGYHVDTADRQPPRVEVKTLRVSVPLTRRIWRPPTDRIEAKMGTVYGPVLGMSSRPMTGFDEKQIYSEVDLLREFGTLLLLAQERNRMGRKEKRPGEGAWWHEKPRWAGMPYEVPGEYPGLYTAVCEESPEAKIANDQMAMSDQKEKRLLGYTARKEKERQRRREELPSDMTARQKSIHSYKRFIPSAHSWDPKVRYVPIGKDANSQWDEVSIHFTGSSRNFHF